MENEVKPQAASTLPPFTLFITVFAAVLTALVIGALVIRAYIFPLALTPVELNANEQVQLDDKLRALGLDGSSLKHYNQHSDAGTQKRSLEPRAYNENKPTREIRFSERELNALLAHNTDLADKVAIDLSDSLVSARILIPLDPDFPVMGGRTLRINTGVSIRFTNSQPIITLKGLSLSGVPLPNAWLGNLKNVNIIEQYGDTGFWKSFANGIDYLLIEEGKLVIKLKE